MPQPKIERYEVVIPAACLMDDYENMTVTTTTGTEVRINKKHASLHGLFKEAELEGRAVKVGYAVYLEKEYVHTAELYGGQPQTELGKEAVKQGAELQPPPKPPQAPKSGLTDKDKDIHKQVALKCAVELAAHGVIRLNSINEYADNMLKYLNGE